MAGLGLVNKPALAGEAPKLAQETGTGTPIFVSDLSRCQPSTALSKVNKKQHWTLIPYVTDKVSGTMIGAGSMADAPDVTIPLGVSGWHAVYVGFWNAHHDYDGGTTIKLKLTDDPCFRPISDGTYSGAAAAPMNWVGTEFQEVFLKYTDLTGRDLTVGQQTKGKPKKAYVAYVKLVPLSKKEVDAIRKDRARKDTRVLIATNDGISWLEHKGATTKEEILEQVEPYRYSDVGKVIWAFSYGDTTNYPSKVGSFMAKPGGEEFTVRPDGEARFKSISTLTSKGLIPAQVALEHVHDMGLKFDAMFRMGVIGSHPPGQGGLPASEPDEGIVRKKPWLRMLAKDGTPLEKASYAFPEVQDHMLSLIREVAERFDIDGVNLGWIRGPQFVGYEALVIEDFKKEYGEDPRKLDDNEERVQRLRAKYVTEFVRKVRQLLNELGSKRGRKIELSAWVYSPETNLFFGLDAETWVAEGLLDSIIAAASRSLIPDMDPYRRPKENNWTVGTAEKDFVQTVKAHNCRFYQNWGSAEAVLQGYKRGVDGFAAWDLNLSIFGYSQEVPHRWALVSRVGHPDEVAAFAKEPPKITTVKLKSVGGFDISHITNRGAKERNYWPPEMLPLYSGG